MSGTAERTTSLDKSGRPVRVGGFLLSKGSGFQRELVGRDRVYNSRPCPLKDILSLILWGDVDRREQEVDSALIFQ